MPRINPIEHANAEGKTRTMLDGIKSKNGAVPNLLATMANGPAVLDAYLGLGRALGGGQLSAGLREQIALTVSGVNGCEYCAAAHTAIGRQVGVADEELASSLRGLSAVPTVAAALEFARRVVIDRGHLDDDDVRRVREAGYSDGDVLEIVANVVATIFSNYVNHIAETEVDFPRVTLGEAAPA